MPCLTSILPQFFLSTSCQILIRPKFASIEAPFANVYQIEVCKYPSYCDVQISIRVKFANICWIAVGILIYAYIYQIEVCKNPLDWDVQISIGLSCANIYGIEFCKNPLDWYLQISIQLRCANNHQWNFLKISDWDVQNLHCK